MGNYFYGENLNNYDGSKYHDYYQKGKAEYYGRKCLKIICLML